MKFLGKLFTVVGVVMLGVVGTLAQDEKTVVNGIMAVTEQSAKLQFTVSELNVGNFFRQGPKIAKGLRDIGTSVAQFTTAIGGDDAKVKAREADAFPDDVAREIVEVLTGFVQVHQLLLNTIIGKHSLAAQFFLTAPIAAALRSLESIVDTFAFTLLALIPTEQDDASFQLDELTVTFKEAIKTYRS
ncbi:hypothetical protein L226DRAFT_614068 [Lentinus tigrinus ALCF2SS1-7]|uniref:Hydrophobic surface binding protein A n=1 Tax=Lentinus tigrinus ALCF2SS1-6 TaxID=1328759 RepID=A0A5C2S7Y0_9APHY|nr:hypothetical protein L227DRAFT_654236 [Lentinus tigrinus ALCF2SS1-6]RPD73564.1 hypothetical protein L226DRAFT_614068 [Lentinus tigrinus ALCF2SS1-7]